MPRDYRLFLDDVRNAALSLDIVWNISQSNVPSLLETVSRMLKEADSSEGRI